MHRIAQTTTWWIATLALGGCALLSPLVGPPPQPHDPPPAQPTQAAATETEKDPLVPPHEYIDLIRDTISLRVQAHCPSPPDECIKDVATLLGVYELKRLALADLSDAFLAEAAATPEGEPAMRRVLTRKAAAAREAEAKAQQDAMKVFNVVWTLSAKLPPPESGVNETYDCSGFQPNDRLSAPDAEYLRGLCTELNESALARLAIGDTPPECERVSGSAGGSRIVASFCVDTLAGGSAAAPASAAPTGCCKVCGPSSQACGNTCIALGKTCHTPPGCACQ